MDKLPLEILQNIFILLPLGERVKCLRVCRSWWNILDKYCLFHHIVIYNNVDQFTKLMSVMEQSPRHAAQVEKLDLFSSVPAFFNKRNLCIIFPNARILKVKYPPRMLNNPIKHFKEPLAFTHSTPKVQDLSDGGFCELACQMISSNLCVLLEKLELNFSFSDNNAHTFLAKFKGHLPVLKKLRIANINMGINDLEDLHNNVPTLQHYWIQCGTIVASKMPDNIAPLPTMEYFHLNIHQVENIDTHIALYKYMTKKYANAVKGRCIDDAIDQYTSSDTKLIYNSAVFDYLRVIAAKSSQFAVSSVPNGINIFNVFDDIDCQFEHLAARDCNGDTFIQDLVQSKQPKSIKVLELSSTLLKSPDILQHFTALTTFTLIILRNSGLPSTINLTDYLNLLPETVKDLTLGCSDMTCVPFNTNMSFIERLEITPDRITKLLGDIISTCFPKLVRLIISGRVSENVNIALHNDSLETISFLQMEGKYGFSFKSASQTIAEHYLCQDEEVTPSTYEEIETLPNLSFTSYKDKNLDISDCIDIF